MVWATPAGVLAGAHPLAKGGTNDGRHGRGLQGADHDHRLRRRRPVLPGTLTEILAAKGLGCTRPRTSWRRSSSSGESGVTASSWTWCSFRMTGGAGLRSPRCQPVSDSNPRGLLPQPRGRLLLPGPERGRHHGAGFPARHPPVYLEGGQHLRKGDAASEEGYPLGEDGLKSRRLVNELLLDRRFLRAIFEVLTFWALVSNLDGRLVIVSEGRDTTHIANFHHNGWSHRSQAAMRSGPRVARFTQTCCEPVRGAGRKTHG